MWPVTRDAVLYSEPGARWWPILLAPGFAVVGIVWDAVLGGGMPVFVWLVAAVVLGAVGSLIIHAARTHTSVELTTRSLRLGPDEIALDEIVRVFPPAPRGRKKHDPREDWESARSLGGLSVVPRGRRGIGVQMRTGALRQAWARDDAALRAQLEPQIERRRRRRKDAPRVAGGDVQ